ncbi:MAG: hypothetical protein ACFWT6_14665 [Virgibacillus proomii]|jgi:D-methionine transport system substrate-binding protein
MKKIVFIFSLLLAAVLITACSKSEATSTVKVGISGSDTTIWDYVAKKSEKGRN